MSGVAAAFDRELIDDRHPAALLHQLARDAARSGADVDHRRARRDRIEGELVAAGVAELQIVVRVVLRAHRLEAPLVEKAGTVRDVSQRREHHVLRVLHPVHAADLVAVVRRNRELDDPLAGVDQLDDDLGVEVKEVRVQAVGNLLQRRDRVDAIAAVKLGEARAEQQVLRPGQDAVADELVERHPALERREPAHHAAAEHRVGLAVPQRRDERRQFLRRVLPVAVNHRHEIEALADREGVADLLVAAVPLVVLVAQHRHGDFRVRPAVRAPDLGRAVARGVVHDEHLAVVVAEDRARDSFEHPLERLFRVVGDDEDHQSGLAHRRTE